MSSFSEGLTSVGQKIGRSAKDWGEGTQAYKDEQNERQSQKNGWQKGGSTMSNMIGTGIGAVTRMLGIGV